MLGTDAAEGGVDRRGIDREAKEWPGSAEMMLLDLSAPCHAAPARGASSLGNGIGQGGKARIHDMALQGSCESIGGTGTVAQAQARAGQAEPCLAYVVFGGDFGKQLGRSAVVVAEAGCGQGQSNHPIGRGEARGPVQPAPRLAGLPSSRGLLATLERFAGKRGVSRQRSGSGQWPTAWGSADCVSACGGNAAKSARASWRP
jgi:hypothetical protein